ncbi:DUF3247 family protein [Luteimonas sp. FCS-9]|uniref:DUF3247 family protein n=1 Tax=Luteimonas sp. FCS-9 TaxID=1547516 RepID=UPI00063E9999|nr:DUF3247 family protein [Luteimonas sp. FCS-9]KLJ01977.1 hypothetical protein WQ56_03755 [Luteimonas sp. FCS-9]
MSQTPPRIHVERAELDALERSIRLLDDEAIVQVTIADGTQVEGVVSARPALEVFRTADGAEGHNALLRLDDLEDPAVPHYVWVGEITAIDRIGSA